MPARSATLAEQEGTQREIADLQQQSADLDALFERRKAQFAGVLAQLEQVQRAIERDEPEESVVPLTEGLPPGLGVRPAAAAAGVPSSAQQQQQQEQQQQQQQQAAAAMQVG